MLSFKFTARTILSLSAVIFMAAALSLYAQDKPAENKVKKEVRKEKVVKAVKEDAAKGCACCSSKETAHNEHGKMEHGKMEHGKMEHSDKKHEGMSHADMKHNVSCTVTTTKDDGETITRETTTTKDGRVEKKVIKKKVIKNEADEADDCCAAPEGKKENTSAVKTEKPWNAVCPVLGNKVDASGPTVTYNGKVYAFCCPGCDTKFQADPGKYSKQLSEDGKKFLN